MKILCLTDFPVEAPDRWLWNYLPDASDDVDFLWAGAADRSATWGKLFTRYPASYRLALRALAQLRRKRYDLVLAWEASVGIPFALTARAFGRAAPPFLLLAFNPGDVGTLFQPLIRLGLKRVSHASVLTRTEAAAYARQYSVDEARLSIIPLPSYDILADVQRLAEARPYSGEPYIHASGRSSRDYGTLIKAVEGLEIKVVIHGRGYNFAGLEIPPNVEIGDLATKEDFHRLVYFATCEVVPLQRRFRPAGSSQAVFAMMMGKPVVATRNPSLGELVDEGSTGLLVAPGDADEMRAALQHLIEHPVEAAAMGRAARRRFETHHTFAAFARRAHDIMIEVVEHATR